MPHICVQVHRYTLRNCEIRIAGGRRIELREQILFARIGASRVNRAPFELDRREHVEGFRIDRGGSVDTDPPTADGILEIDHLDATVGAMEERPSSRSAPSSWSRNSA
jgi:hypothetical protein